MFMEGAQEGANAESGIFFSLKINSITMNHPQWIEARR